MSLRALDYRACIIHGPDSLHHRSVCCSCEAHAIPVSTIDRSLKKINVPPWMRRVILNVDVKGSAERTVAQKRMRRWRAKAEKARGVWA